MQDVFKVEDEDPILFLEHVFRTCLPNGDLRTDLLTATGGFFVCPEARDTSREMSARDCQRDANSGGYALRPIASSQSRVKEEHRGAALRLVCSDYTAASISNPLLTRAALPRLKLRVSLRLFPGSVVCEPGRTYHRPLLTRAALLRLNCAEPQESRPSLFAQQFFSP